MLVTLLKTYPEVFPNRDLKLVCYSKRTHRIDTANNAPVSQALRRFAYWQLIDIKKQIDEMLEFGVVVSCEVRFQTWSWPGRKTVVSAFAPIFET